MLENKDGDSENPREIEELHPLISTQEQLAMLDDTMTNQNLVDSYIVREEIAGYIESDSDNQMDVEALVPKKGKNFPQPPRPIDIGEVLGQSLTTQVIENIVTAGHKPHPKKFPCDCIGKEFPTYILERIMKNGEREHRTWLVFSEKELAIFCLPCVLFSSSIEPKSVGQSQSASASNKGWEQIKSGKFYTLGFLSMKMHLYTRLAI